MEDDAHAAERRFHRHVEPVAQLGFAAYEHRRGCADLTQMEWYFGGRLACLGPVSGEAAVALLAVLHPSGVVDGTRSTWSKTDPDTLIECRLDAIDRFLASRETSGFDPATTSALLRRAIDALEPAGHTLFAGWRARRTEGCAMRDIWLGAVTQPPPAPNTEPLNHPDDAHHHRARFLSRRGLGNSAFANSCPPLPTLGSRPGFRLPIPL